MTHADNSEHPQDYENWILEQETFSDLIAKQNKIEIDQTKLAKK